jgi:hypothetical protein
MIELGKNIREAELQCKEANKTVGEEIEIPVEVSSKGSKFESINKSKSNSSKSSASFSVSFAMVFPLNFIKTRRLE